MESLYQLAAAGNIESFWDEKGRFGQAGLVYDADSFTEKLFDVFLESTKFCEDWKSSWSLEELSKARSVLEKNSEVCNTWSVLTKQLEDRHQQVAERLKKIEGCLALIEERLKTPRQEISWTELIKDLYQKALASDSHVFEDAQGRFDHDDPGHMFTGPELAECVLELFSKELAVLGREKPSWNPQELDQLHTRLTRADNQCKTWLELAKSPEHQQEIKDVKTLVKTSIQEIENRRQAQQKIQEALKPGTASKTRVEFMRELQRDFPDYPEIGFLLYIKLEEMSSSLNGFSLVLTNNLSRTTDLVKTQMEQIEMEQSAWKETIACLNQLMTEQQELNEKLLLILEKNGLHSSGTIVQAVQSHPPAAPESIEAEPDSKIAEIETALPARKATRRKRN